MTDTRFGVNSGMYLNWNRSKRNQANVRFGSVAVGQQFNTRLAAFGQKRTVAPLPIFRVEVVLEFLSPERHYSVINHFKSDESTSRRNELRLFRTQWSADALLAFIKNFLVPILDCLVIVHKNRRRFMIAALGQQQSFVILILSPLLTARSGRLPDPLFFRRP